MQLTTTAATVGEIDRDVATLRVNAALWAKLGFAGKIRHLRTMRARTVEVAAQWVDLAVRAKGIAGTQLAGEEWLSGPYALLTTLDRLGATLGEIARNGAPAIAPRAIRTRANGQVCVEVFPAQTADTLLLNGVRAEMWMEPEITRDDVLARTASALREARPEGSVTLVLGAGNIASIPPLDVLAALYAANSVAVLKLNPVNAYLEPVLTRVFSSLIDEGFVRIAGGGADVGGYLVSHRDVDAIHLTGGERTHRAIAAAAPDKTITSELGNVTPVIVVPGPWSKADIAYQAAHIASMKMHNAGANCISAQLLVTPSSWDRTPALRDAVRGALRAAPARPAYYPGSDGRIAALGADARAEQLGADCAGVARLFVAGLDPADATQAMFCDEAFATALGETSLPGDDAAAFLRNAVAFVNAVPSGTLGVSILIHPRTMAELGDAFEDALAELRYGCVAVNAWSGVGFLLATASWGAYPGASTREEPGSGIGVVHNAYLFDRPQKTVVYQPFAPFPRSLTNGERTLLPPPPWFVTHRRAADVARKLFAYTAKPSLPRLMATAIAAMRA